MLDKHRITILGSGNVAWQLSRSLAKSGYQIEAIYSRQQRHAEELAQLFQDCTVVLNTDFSKSNSGVFLLAVSDNALEEVISALVVPSGALIAHTSGSVSVEVLNGFSRYGVLYPLQTFTKGKETDLREVPFGIEGSDETVLAELSALAASLSKNVQHINSAQRKIIHLAAVFACNFTNHLLSISQEILKMEQLDLELLRPLVTETIQKAFELGPQKAQTGPAIRGDKKILEQHIDLLRNTPELQELYRLFSKRIERQFDNLIMC